MLTTDPASDLGVSADDLRTAAAVATALAGGAKWDGTYDALEKSYLEWAADNGCEPGVGMLSARTYGDLARMFAAQPRWTSAQSVAPLGMKYMNCRIVISVGVEDGVIVWE